MRRCCTRRRSPNRTIRVHCGASPSRRRENHEAVYRGNHLASDRCSRRSAAHAARRLAVQRRARVHQGDGAVRGAGQEVLRQAGQLRAAQEQRARPGEGLFRLHEPGQGGRLRDRVARAHVDFLARGAVHRRAVHLPRPRSLEQGARRRPPETDRRRDRAEGRRDADRLRRRRHAQHLRQQAGAQHGRAEAGRAGEGRQAQAHCILGPGADEESGGPGDRGLRQGDRRRRHFREDQRDQVRRFIELYHRLLTWLMVGTVAILIVPVTLQIISRYTELIPSWIWTEELSRFLLIWMVMLGAMIGIREHSHFEVDVWPDLGPKSTALLRIVSQVCVLAFALVFVWWGIEFVRFGWDQLSELAELPMPWIFIAWPLAGFTWILFLGESLVDNFRILRS